MSLNRKEKLPMREELLLESNRLLTSFVVKTNNKLIDKSKTVSFVLYFSLTIVIKTVFNKKAVAAIKGMVI